MKQFTKAWVWLTLLSFLFAWTITLLADIKVVEPVKTTSFSPTYIRLDDILVDFPNYGHSISDPIRERVYVSFWYQNIVVADINQASVQTTLSNVHRPDMLALNPDGSRLYAVADVLNYEDGLITVIDTNTFAIVATHVYTNMTGFPYYSDIRAIAVSAADKIYVAPQGDYTHQFFDVMDGMTGQILASVPVSDTIVSMAVSGTKLFVTSTQTTGDALLRYDINDVQPALETTVPISQAGLISVAPDGSTLTVNWPPGSIYQYDSTTLAETAVYTTSDGYTNSVYTPDGQSLLALYKPMGYYGPAGLHLIDLASGMIVRTFIDESSVSQPFNAFPFANERVAVVYNDRIRSLIPADYTAALPIIINDVCVAPIIDDFSNPNSGWPILTTDALIYRYLNGEYNIFHRDQDRWAAATRGDIWESGTQLAEIEGYIADGNGIWGLIFGLNTTWSDFYTFEIWPQNQSWYFFHYTNSSGWVLIANGNSNAIHPVQSNTLSLKQVYGSQQLQINGVNVHENWTPIQGRVGVSGGSFSRNADIRYDNYVFVGERCPMPAGLSVIEPLMQTHDLPLPPLR